MIRDATKDDVDALIEMGRAFFEEAGLCERFTALGLPEVAFCPESFIRSCDFLSTVGIMLVAEQDGKIVGMFGAGISPALWNFSVLLAQEVWWYVRPENRKGVGVALLKEFEKRATARGVTLGAMVAEDGLRGETVGRLYKAKAYCPAEQVFWKRLGATH